MQYMFDAQMILTSAAGGVSQSIDARTMLANGDYKLWTSGPVAQTIILADDSAQRKYDIGFGDGYTPFRPRFYATFWPATHQVFVRFVGENDNTQAVEDLSYSLTLTLGNAVPYKRSGLTHWAMTAWSKSFWLGGTPSPQVNIDNNLAYLETTRFLPNYDPAITVPASAVASEYNYWTGRPHDLYDGSWDGGVWSSGMGVPGARAESRPIRNGRSCGSTPATGGCARWRSAWPISPPPSRSTCARVSPASGCRAPIPPGRRPGSAMPCRSPTAKPWCSSISTMATPAPPPGCRGRAARATTISVLSGRSTSSSRGRPTAPTSRARSTRNTS